MRKYKQMAFAIATLVALTIGVAAQETPPDSQKERPRTATPAAEKPAAEKPAGEKQDQKPVVGESETTKRPASDIPDEIQAKRQEQTADETAVNTFYNN